MITPIRNTNYFNTSAKYNVSKQNNVSFNGLADNLKTHILNHKEKKVLNDSKTINNMAKDEFNEVQDLIKYAHKNKVRQFVFGSKIVTLKTSNSLKTIVMDETENKALIRRTIYSPSVNADWYQNPDSHYKIYSIYNGVKKTNNDSKSSYELFEFQNGDPSNYFCLKNYSIDDNNVEKCDELFDFKDGKLVRYRTNYVSNPDLPPYFDKEMNFHRIYDDYKYT